MPRKNRRRRIEVEIFKYLFNKKEASGYEIAKSIRAPMSSVYYYLDKLHQKNIVVELGEKYYGLNPIFLDKSFWDQTIGALRQILAKLDETVVEIEDKEVRFEKPDPSYALSLIVDVLLS